LPEISSTNFNDAVDVYFPGAAKSRASIEAFVKEFHAKEFDWDHDCHVALTVQDYAWCRPYNKNKLIAAGEYPTVQLSPKPGIGGI